MQETTATSCAGDNNSMSIAGRYPCIGREYEDVTATLTSYLCRLVLYEGGRQPAPCPFSPQLSFEHSWQKVIVRPSSRPWPGSWQP